MIRKHPLCRLHRGENVRLQAKLPMLQQLPQQATCPSPPKTLWQASSLAYLVAKLWSMRCDQVWNARSFVLFEQPFVWRSCLDCYSSSAGPASVDHIISKNSSEAHQQADATPASQLAFIEAVPPPVRPADGEVAAAAAIPVKRRKKTKSLDTVRRVAGNYDRCVGILPPSNCRCCRSVIATERLSTSWRGLFEPTLPSQEKKRKYRKRN